MQFGLRLANPARLRWLLVGWATWLPLTVGLVVSGLGWLVPVYCLALLVPSVLYNRLVRQPGWVLIATDGIAWANPADSPPERFQFAELRAYRFDYGKSDGLLTLYPRAGEKVTIRGRLREEFGAMQHALERTIRQHNQANPGAEVVQEPSDLTKFFVRPLATRVLWVLLAAGAGWTSWAVSHDAPGVAYLPILFIPLPYLTLWANFYYERPTQLRADYPATPCTTGSRASSPARVRRW